MSPSTPHIALLRGVNVGGRRPVRMTDLQALMGALGFAGARTLLQSGNIVFRAGQEGTAALERLLETQSARRLGLACDFHVRTLAEWEKLIAANPFDDEARLDPGHLLVVALKTPVTACGLQALTAAVPGRERVSAAGRTAYLYYPDGVGSSRLTTAVIDRCLQTRGTARNWNTVLKLAALARELKA